MQEYSVGEFARARVWLGALPTARGRKLRTLEVACLPSLPIANNQVAVELWRVQGGRVAYGLLGGSWTGDEEGRRRVVVDVSEDRGPLWADAPCVEAHLGLPAEYAPGVLQALQGVNVNLGSGTLHITHAAHATVGSNQELFARLATAVARLTLVHEQGSEVAALVEQALHEPSRPNPIAVLQRASREGASLKTLFDVVHQECAKEPYDRGTTLYWFTKTFEIGVRDLHTLASWEGFGGGATVPLEKIEDIYRAAPLRLR